MARTRQKSHSTSLPSDVDQRVREIAARENRSFANVIENSVRVFTLLPKGLRDSLIDATADSKEAQKRFAEVSRQIAALEARQQFDAALASVAKVIELPDDPFDYDSATVTENCG